VSELELALLNLAVNARDAMIGGGRLTIKAVNARLRKNAPPGLEGEFVLITVADTGTGISPEVLEHVFEPFFTTKDIGKGTGLGLSQVYGFARQAGGMAAVDSVVGRGTTISIYLPRTTEQPSSELEVGRSPLPRPLGGGSVLLVEDNPGVSDVTRQLLEELGFHVLCASDSASAEALLGSASEQVRLVLSDIVMPGGGSGLQLARLVRQNFGKRVPVILATGYSDQAQMAGNEGFPILRKPYDVHALRKIIAEVQPDEP
jgi:two-component system NtrC family sensor kinase